MIAADCPLCRKLAVLDRQPPEDLVWSFPHSVAVLGDFQAYLGYCILIARQHAGELSHLPDDDRRAFLEEMCTLARAIGDCFRPHKLNYELLGNQVPHLHWHIVPRYRDDPDRLDPIWLPLERAKQDKAARQRLRDGPTPRPTAVAMLRQRLQELLGPRP